MNRTELINISIGELWDKFSILLIKKEKLNEENELYYINNELDFLTKNMSKYSYIQDLLFINLKKINLELWDTENLIREKEKNQEFDQEFIKFARDVYSLNDKRSFIKYNINKRFGSSILEIKNYSVPARSADKEK
tara:strand:- start:394 stop:801 length:408 start_codon:yes stop_codon:yes gene_type:complete